jgi:preprotein translocase subunit YajC
MLNLYTLLFADTAADPAAAENGWVMWVLLGVVFVAMIAMMIIPQRKQKKKAAEMMEKLGIGSTITTIGGIVGKVIELDSQNVWIETGVEGNTTTMKFIRQAIYSIAPAEGSAEAKALEKAAKDEVDEIK